MKTKKISLFMSVFFGAVAYTCATEGATIAAAPGQVATKDSGDLAKIPFETLIGKAKAAKSHSEKSVYAAVIRKRLPQNEGEKQVVIELLESSDADDKVIAMEVLGKIREKRVMSAVIKNLKHADNGVKMMAAVTLGKIGDADAVEPLLDNPDLIILEFGYCPTAEIGAPALPKLVNAARKINLLGLLPKQERKDRRSRKAAACIGQVRDKKAIPQLMKLLRDDDADVRLAAVQALATMKVKEAEPEFDKLLQDSNETIRMFTLRTLANADKAKYLPRVVETIQKKRDYEKSHAIKLLGDLEARETVGKLEELLKDEDEFNRHYAAHALWKITGKVYPYNKGTDILHMEKGWRERLEDARKTHNEDPKNAILEAQRNGYLLEEKAE